MDQETNSQANSEATPPGEAVGAGGGAAATQATQEATPPATVSREAYQALQSQKDKAEADARKAREDAERIAAEARESQRTAELAGIKPEERDAVIRKWRLEDKERELAEREREAEDIARELAIQRLSLEHGIKPEDLKDIQDVNEMRARAAELKAERLAEELEALKSGKTPPAAGNAPSGQQHQSPQAPAGMRAQPPGSGQGGAQAYDPAKFKGTGNIADAMRAKREAGAEEVAEVALGPRS